jgi:hypothetical protein
MTVDKAFRGCVKSVVMGFERKATCGAFEGGFAP